MGQYYILINLDARQCMSVFAGGFSFGNDPFSSGCKLAEQWWNLGRKPFLALSLLAAGNKISGPIGSWAGDRIVLIGDYSDDYPDFLNEEEIDELKSSKCNLYSLANSFEEATEAKDQWMKDAKEKLKKVETEDTHVVAMNSDKKEYLDPVVWGNTPRLSEFYMKQDGIMKALLGCLFYSTGGGGGDIEELREGRWAGDHISLVEKSEAESAGCTDVSKAVKEFLDPLDN